MIIKIVTPIITSIARTIVAMTGVKSKVSDASEAFDAYNRGDLG